MTEILISEQEDKSIRVKIEGNTQHLIDMLASAILNDPNFGILVITTLAAIADKKDRFPDINPN